MSASQRDVYVGDVELTWDEYDDATSGRVYWTSGAATTFIGTIAVGGTLLWDSTKFANGAGEIVCEYFDEKGVAVGKTSSAGTIINDPGVVVKRGKIDANETWESDKVYVVVGALEIAANATLTVAPTTVVKFWKNGYLNLAAGAKLVASAASVWTRAEDDSVGGDANFDGEKSTPKYGGAYWRGAGVDGATIDASAVVKYVATTYSGRLAQSETWLGGQVYRITGDLTVPSGVTLTIMPGAILKFDAGKSLIVEEGGKLTAQGTTAQPIVFTSINDDQTGGDTNGDDGETSPSSGDWNKILAQGVVEVNYAHILYSGAEPNNSDDGAIFAMNGGQVVFNNGVIAHSKLVGALCDNLSSLRMTNSVIYDAMYATRNGDYVNCVFNDLTYWANANYYYYDGSFINCVVADVSDKFFSGGTPRYTFQNCLFWNPKGAGPQTFAEVGKNGNIGRIRFSGTPRVTDDYSARVGTPNADGNYVDIGAYEFADGAASSLDLEPVDLKAPTSAAVGETVTLEWTTRNNGTVAATGAWNDRRRVDAKRRRVRRLRFCRRTKFRRFGRSRIRRRPTGANVERRDRRSRIPRRNDGDARVGFLRRSVCGRRDGSRRVGDVGDVEFRYERRRDLFRKPLSLESNAKRANDDRRRLDLREIEKRATFGSARRVARYSRLHSRRPRL